MLLLRITVLEFSALLQHSIALYCVLPESLIYTGNHLIKNLFYTCSQFLKSLIYTG